jgi:hypothetical protein
MMNSDFLRAHQVLGVRFYGEIIGANSNGSNLEPKALRVPAPQAVSSKSG